MGVKQNTNIIFDHFEKKWVPVPAVKHCTLLRANRRDIIQLIINNAFESDLPIARLYSQLLVRTFCQADPELMKEFGAEVVKMTCAR